MSTRARPPVSPQLIASNADRSFANRSFADHSITNHSVADRINSRHDWRRWWADRWIETPAWLMSLVLHQCVLLVTGAMLVPMIDVRRVELLSMWSTLSEEAASEVELAIDLVDLEVTEAGETTELVELPTLPTLAVESPAEPEIESEPPAVALAESPIPSQEAPAPEIESAKPTTEAATDETGTLAANASDVSFTVASFTGSSIEVDDAVAAFTNPENGLELPEVTLESNPEDDAIVDRFIQYDIGQLRGEAGAQAMRRFNNLGPESIPALVKGLNRSAAIQATCPVGVLSQKLRTELARTSDRAMLRYALENIGRDVPSNQPHAKRINSFREQLRAQYDASDSLLRERLAEQGLPARDELLMHLRQLESQSWAAWRIAFESGDPERMLAAAMHVAIGNIASLSITERMQLADQLTQRLATAEPELESALDGALERLSQGTGMSPPEDRSAAGWQAAWAEYRSTVWEREARDELARCRAIEQRGDTVAAARAYREFLERYAESNSGAAARDRLADLASYHKRRTLLLMGRNLERAGRDEPAAQRYRELVANFPDTDEAREARERLLALSK
ncbi:MAG: tetratricopeptide repeat protein [Pirellulaceae bacterium]